MTPIRVFLPNVHIAQSPWVFETARLKHNVAEPILNAPFIWRSGIGTLPKAGAKSFIAGSASSGHCAAMSFLPARVLVATMAALLLAGAAAAPAAASGAPSRESAASGPIETVQLFDRNGRRDDRSRRRDRRIEKLRPPPPNRDDESNLERRQQRQQQQEQDRALDAVRRGEVLPLGSIIRNAQSSCPGTFLDASLQRRGKNLAYRVALLRPSGKRVILLVDAASGAVIGGQCR
jgi:hypothetical protein